MRLVDDDVLERELLQCRLLDEADLVRRDQHVEVLWEEARRDDLRALLFAAGEEDGVHVGCPPLELARPVLESRLGYDYQMWTVSVTIVAEI